MRLIMFTVCFPIYSQTIHDHYCREIHPLRTTNYNFLFLLSSKQTKRSIWSFDFPVICHFLPIITHSLVFSNRTPPRLVYVLQDSKLNVSLIIHRASVLSVCHHDRLRVRRTRYSRSYFSFLESVVSFQIHQAGQSSSNLHAQRSVRV